MTGALLLISAAFTVIAAVTFHLARRQAQANVLAHTALEQWEADLRRRERNVADNADRWITERGRWAGELEATKAAALRADYWQRRAGEYKQQLQEAP